MDVKGDIANAPGAPIDEPPKAEETNTKCAATPSEDQTLPETKPKNVPETKSTEDGDAITKIFRFLSTATAEVLSAIAVALSAATYLILGKVGLLLIGAFGGVVLFIHYEQKHPEVSRAVRGEKGIDAIERLIREMKDSFKKEETGEQDDESVEQQTIRTFDDFRPETRDAMKGLVDAITRDYVKWWYGPILPADRSFPLACRKVLTSFLVAVSNHLARKRPADSFLDFLTNSSSMAIVFFSELSAAFNELPPDSRATASDAVYNYLASNPDCNLANLLNQKQQVSKFRMVAEDLLAFLERGTYNCDPARTFLKEILAGVILEMTLQSCSKPEWINGWIVYLLEAGEPDFNQAIDVGMQTGRDANLGFTAEVDGTGASTPGKTSRSSAEMERGRKRESMTHRKQLSKADEEMEEAMEEMKRMNQMIAEEEAMRVQQQQQQREQEQKQEQEQRQQQQIASSSAAVERLSSVLERTSHDVARQQAPETPGDASPKSQSSPDKASLKDASTDSQSNRGEPIHTPGTPRSADSGSQGSSPKPVSAAPFTSFDQIVPPGREEEDEPRKAPPLTLHNATITIHDEPGNEKGRIRGKPNWDLLIQIEPASSTYPGWMIVRKYADFETLHEVLRRIATISGATAFVEQHGILPPWKAHTRATLRGELERYLRDACWYQTLAECEGMKRFLDKDQGLPQAEEKTSFGFDVLGKGVLDVGKGAMQGGKAMVGGVNSVLGNIGLGQKKAAAQSGPLPDRTQDSRLVISTTPGRVNSAPSPSTSQRTRDSMDSQRSSVVATQPGKIAPMERRPSYHLIGDEPATMSRSQSEKWETPQTGSGQASRQHSRASSLAPRRSPSTVSLEGMKLPPPPDEMTDDYEAPGHQRSKTNDSFLLTPQNSFSANPGFSSPARSLSISNTRKPTKPARQFSPISEQETRVAVELMFATINELYTLSSAWNIRRTLLAAAKSFLLRPGNPSLTSIQSLMQESVIEANTSDAGLASHLRKLRINTLPTEEELAAWPAEMTPEEKQKLRIKARALLIKSGVPAALMGVMGQNATSEALGRLFDCLQIEEVSRGFLFGVMLQAIRIVTH